MTITVQRASISAKDVLDSVGVNMHLDFHSPGYNDFAVTIAALDFLGIKHLRDCPAKDEDLTGPRAWSLIAAATGAKFLPFIGETNPANGRIQLDRFAKLAAQDILEGVEGPNEWDAAFAINSGGNLTLAAAFQPLVWAQGQFLTLPVVNISFGAGWTAANNWQGNYASQGDLTATCDFANAHTYPQPGQKIIPAMDRLNSLAHLAASGKPVLTTEIGFPEAQFPDKAHNAKLCLLCIVGGLKLGNPRSYFYALFDDVAGKFGIMNSDGTPKPAGQAISNFLAILKDPAQNQLPIPTFLAYEVAGIVGDESILCQKSDGTFQLIIWDEINPAHNVIVNLGVAAKTVKVFDPIKGISPISTFQNVSSVTISLADYPIIIDIDSEGAVVQPPADPPPVNPPPVTPPPVTPPTGTGWMTPASFTISPVGVGFLLPGVSFVDAWALAHAGTCALNISVSEGTLSTTDNTGHPIAGSGTGKIKLAAKLSTLNDFLSRLTFHPTKTGVAVLTLDMWNQAGKQTKLSINIDVV